MQYIVTATSHAANVYQPGTIEKQKEMNILEPN